MSSRLFLLVLKDLAILRDYISANYEEYDKDWMLDQVHKAETAIRQMLPEREDGSFKDWIS